MPFSSQKINSLRQNARSLVRELGLLNDAYFEVGVTLAERHLLLELSSAKQPLTAKEIAERLLLDKSTISRLVAKAVKKGFITLSTDKNDKRKKFLQFTSYGRDTLSSFESIAFNQTKKALETLSQDEFHHVFEGMALYTRGLRNSRLQKEKTAVKEVIKDADLSEIEEQLRASCYTLDKYTTEDEKPLFAIFKEVVDAGSQFPYEDSSLEEFHTQFFGPTSQVYVCRSFEGEVIGGFYLKPNYSGRSCHISNAAYMIKSSLRGKGIGTKLIKASLEIARKSGFLAMQYNMVLSENIRAIKLYERLGFEIIGTIPNAIRNSDGSFQEGHILYRSLESNK